MGGTSNVFRTQGHHAPLNAEPCADGQSRHFCPGSNPRAPCAPGPTATTGPFVRSFRLTRPPPQRFWPLTSIKVSIGPAPGTGPRRIHQRQVQRPCHTAAHPLGRDPKRVEPPIAGNLVDRKRLGAGRSSGSVRPKMAGSMVLFSSPSAKMDLFKMRGRRSIVNWAGPS